MSQLRFDSSPVETNEPQVQTGLSRSRFFVAQIELLLSRVDLFLSPALLDMSRAAIEAAHIEDVASRLEVDMSRNESSCARHGFILVRVMARMALPRPTLALIGL
jgi:hypothetical protein